MRLSVSRIVRLELHGTRQRLLSRRHVAHALIDRGQDVVIFSRGMQLHPLARQLHGWLENIGVACATPKPLCSLTEKDYLVTRRLRRPYSDPDISEFAHYFGQPNLALTVDAQTNQIIEAQVIRDAVCGCARYVAQKLVGVSVDEAEYITGMAHHHYPCLASMGIDADFGDTLMHISGNLIKDNIAEQIKPFKKVQYIAPGFRSSDVDLKKD